MELENDSQEAFPEIGAILSASVSGGIGGRGGRGGQDGGAGGNGEGPTFTVSHAERLIVHVNDGSARRNSSTLASAIDSAPPAISVCDIHLQQEVYLDNSRVCIRRRNAVRRYYSAQVKDRREMTVVFYEGQDAEEELKRDVANYMKFRHPSFLQLFGTVRSEYVHASIFYEVMIPWSNIMKIYQQSPMVVSYIYASMANEFKAASDYFRARFNSGLHTRAYTLFLRPSTGQLCIDLEGFDYLFFPVTQTENISPMSLLRGILTRFIFDALKVKDYHSICQAAQLGRHSVSREFLLTTTLHLGAVYHATEHRNLSSPLAIAPTLDTGLGSTSCLDPTWKMIGNGTEAPRITKTGWNRFAVSGLVEREGNPISLHLYAQLHNRDPNLWLSQANHILKCHGDFSNTEDYALFTWIQIKVELQLQSVNATDWHSLTGFLFLCPSQSFQVGPVSFRCPENVGYWSLNPSGGDQLSVEQASELGFPAICVSLSGHGTAWSDTIYTGLRQFHQGKGFDPDSQDLARHLGVPLYQLYSDFEKSLNVNGGQAWIEEVSSSRANIDQPVDEGEPGILDIVEDEKCESVPRSGDLDEDSEVMVVSSPMKMLALIQLSLILLITVLDLYGSL
ncbi:hypothetical protein R3P38DRAFT_3354652 [Favolaschia claudopus]|uniref:Uncharacterized protein n=1 Tax=Favolaschia claudopus TaxID=2862362 RepID=A0AAW0BMB6_9AGAR